MSFVSSQLSPIFASSNNGTLKSILNCLSTKNFKFSLIFLIILSTSCVSLGCTSITMLSSTVLTIQDSFVCNSYSILIKAKGTISAVAKDCTGKFFICVK